ncbi:MAG TPA: lipocalin family protein [Gemmatimonadaceae bacterium]|nr:lipocalin family protein [Gemmatimonadaceae bacterium]
MRQSWRKLRPTILAAIPIALMACGSSTTAPSNSVAGSYAPLVWVTVGGSGQTSELQVGSTLTLNLHSNGLVSGSLHLGATGSRPASDADMSGSWTLTGSTITISQSADTFVRNTSFEISPDPVRGWDLAGDVNYANTHIQIILIPA